MPFELIRSDITTMRVDAVVNAANSRLQRGGGVCGTIFSKADGAQLQAACNEIGFCAVGDAVLTPSFGLPAPYVIHAVGPIWQGGAHREEELLRSAYAKSLDAARKHGLRSIAFPLISSGICGYPKRQALSVAVSAIGDWLMKEEYDMQAYLVLFDRAAFELGGTLHSRVRAFIDERYVEEHAAFRRNAPMEIARQMEYMDAAVDAQADFESEACAAPSADDFAPAPSAPSFSAPLRPAKRSLEDVLKQAGESFSEMLFRLIDERGLTDPEVYKRANLDRKLFSKIRSNPAYQPGKNTVLALSIALELNLDQTTDLLRRAGFALSPSSKADLIVEYFIRERQYSIHKINETLFAFDQKLLGAQ